MGERTKLALRLRRLREKGYSTKDAVAIATRLDERERGTRRRRNGRRRRARED